MNEQINTTELNFPVSKSELTRFCERWKITELAVFGSAIRDDFDAEYSDIDLLATFAADAEWSLMDQVEMQEELKSFFDREVDLVSRRAIEKSENWIRRSAILSHSKIIYAA